jgi:hypothetical protein
MPRYSRSRSGSESDRRSDRDDDAKSEISDDVTKLAKEAPISEDDPGVVAGVIRLAFVTVTSELRYGMVQKTMRIYGNIVDAKIDPAKTENWVEFDSPIGAAKAAKHMHSSKMDLNSRPPQARVAGGVRAGTVPLRTAMRAAVGPRRTGLTLCSLYAGGGV